MDERDETKGFDYLKQLFGTEQAEEKVKKSWVAPMVDASTTRSEFSVNDTGRMAVILR